MLLNDYTMNKLYTAALAFVLAVAASSCEKDLNPSGSASLTLFNAIVGSKPLVTNFSNGDQLYYKTSIASFGYGLFANANQLSYYVGQQVLEVRPDTASASKPLFELMLDLPAGSITSLYFTGAIDDPDTLLIREQLPYYSSSDSIAGIRFVNLSPGSAPVSVNIQGRASGSTVSSLPYKGITAFLPFDASAPTSQVIFEFRDMATGTLITTYTARNFSVVGTLYAANNWLFRNNTLALIGQPGATGTNAQKIAVIRHF